MTVLSANFTVGTLIGAAMVGISSTLGWSAASWITGSKPGGGAVAVDLLLVGRAVAVLKISAS